MSVPYRIQLEQTVESGADGATVVTANTRACRKLLHACEQRRKRTAGAWRTPFILPLPAWVDELWQAGQVSGALDRILLGPLQQQALWARIVDESTSASAVLHSRELARLAAQAWEAMHACSVPFNAREFRVTVESNSFLEWSDSFRDFTAGRKWLDAARQLDSLVPLLPALKSSLPNSIVFAGFDQLTPQQQKFVAALRAKTSR